MSVDEVRGSNGGDYPLLPTFQTSVFVGVMVGCKI